MYASLLISLLAAFIAMLGKQWLNRYLRNSGGSMIERCGDRQRKCDGLEKWPLNFFIESLPVMLQVALLLLACGLCRYMWSINDSVAYTLTSLTGLGVTFFIAIVIAGMSSYACPFQTPASTTLHGPWKKVRRGVVSSGVRSQRALSRIVQTLKQTVWSPRDSPLPTTAPPRNIQAQESEPWLKPNDLAIIRRTNANDARCVSWILRNITDPEALDAAIRLAGTIRWFDNVFYPDPNYDFIVSTFEACFDTAGKLYPGSRDRAYYSGRAMVWINTLASCKDRRFARRFPLSRTQHEGPGLDPDLRHLLHVNQGHPYYDWRNREEFVIGSEHTPSHTQWVSDVLLNYSWAFRLNIYYIPVLNWIPDARETKIVIPLTLNRLLEWCLYLGSPPAEEVLVVQNKSYDTSCFALQIAYSTLH